MDVFRSKRVLCICLLSLVVCSIAQAQRAIPELTGPVVDEAGILSENTEHQLTAMIKAHEDSTSNQLAVLTISSLEGENLEPYSLEVARTWALGQADKNNGVLLLVAVAERRIRIEVGYGLEGDLPDVTAKRIIDGEMTPYFREGDYDGGVEYGVRSILDVIEGTYVPSAASNFEVTIWLRLQVGLLTLFFPFLFLGTGIFRSRMILLVRLLFMSPLIFFAGFVIFPPFGGLILISVVYAVLFSIRKRLGRSEKWSPILESIKRIKPGEAITFDVGGWTWTYKGAKPYSGRPSSGGNSGSSSSYHSSSSGYSGGGGSFGGGGASGGW